MTRHSFDKEYWDGVWRAGRGAAMSAGPPNPHLVREIGDLTPGTALEAGCGAGTEAIWLAARGWRVTAVDIAADALDRAARKAAGDVAERLRWIEADLSTWEPGARYDLVTTHYAHPAMPQLAFYGRIASWVAPGGTLFIVGHLHHDHHDLDQPGTGPGGDRAHGHHGSEPPASASATAEGITARLDPAVWEIATARKPHRTLTGADGRATPVHDVVVKALRRP